MLALTRPYWPTGQFPHCRHTGRSCAVVSHRAHKPAYSHHNGFSFPCMNRTPKQLSVVRCVVSGCQYFSVAFCRIGYGPEWGTTPITPVIYSHSEHQEVRFRPGDGKHSGITMTKPWFQQRLPSQGQRTGLAKCEASWDSRVRSGCSFIFGTVPGAAAGCIWGTFRDSQSFFASIRYQIGSKLIGCGEAEAKICSLP